MRLLLPDLNLASPRVVPPDRLPFLSFPRAYSPTRSHGARDAGQLSPLSLHQIPHGSQDPLLSPSRVHSFSFKVERRTMEEQPSGVDSQSSQVGYFSVAHAKREEPRHKVRSKKLKRKVRKLVTRMQNHWAGKTRSLTGPHVFRKFTLEKNGQSATAGRFVGIEKSLFGKHIVFQE